MNVGGYKHVYFVGIGGIGMSALARYFIIRNVKVSGYDKTETALTRKLVGEGIDITYEDNKEHLSEDIDLVVYTPAVPKELGILKALESREVPVVKRAKLLGIISEQARTIAIAGTHGKTTTTSLVAHCLKDSGLEISAFLGGILTGYETNYFLGTSDWMVVEADEFDRSFHHLKPEIAIVNAMDADHLDIYGTQEKFSEAFFEFIMQMRKGGLLLLKEGVTEHFTPAQWMAIQEHVEVKVFGFGQDCDVKISIDHYAMGGRPVFDLYQQTGNNFHDLLFTLPGDHNVSNASAAVLVCERVGLSETQIKHSLAGFLGVKRRFERIVETEGKVYIDDYAHHPQEIKAVCKAIRDAYKGKQILAIFQPHLYSRTRDFMGEFAEALDGFDEILLLDIYPARELPIPGITSLALAEKMHKPVTVVSKNELIGSLRQKTYDVVLTIGAGDIDTQVTLIKKALESK